MENQIKIDYENMPNQSNSIRGQAIEINNKLLAIYRKISEMHICWYGKRYNELVTKFNELAPQLNLFLEAIVGEVPYMFEEIANTVSDVDIKQNVAVPQKESIQKIVEGYTIKNNTGNYKQVIECADILGRLTKELMDYPTLSRENIIEENFSRNRRYNARNR